MAKVVTFTVVSGPFAGATLLKQTTELSPNKPVTVADIRQRVRIQEAAEKAVGNCIVIENADYDKLKEIVNEFPYNVSNKAVLTFIDDVLAAKDVPKET